MAKPARTIADQLQLLESRGMLFRDRTSVPHYLSNISYYRLKGYWWDMQVDKENHIFKQSIAQIRNYCAHHSRLWNKNLPGTPKLLSKPPYHWVNYEFKNHDNQKLYVHLCLMRYLLNIIAPENNFNNRLEHLLSRYPNVDLNALGIQPDWTEQPLWK